MNVDPGILAAEADYTLLVPYALTADGGLVGAKHADRSTAYFCPECRKEVYLRVPRTRRRRHFAHHHENSNCPFQTEQKRRIIAKHQVYWAFYAWVTGQEKAPVLVHECTVCRRAIRRPVAGKIAFVERDYPQAGNVPALDVALLNAERKVCGAVIIYDSHTAGAGSLELYGSLPTLLVRPKDLFECPGGIPVYRESNTQPVPCPACARVKTLGEELEEDDSEDEEDEEDEDEEENGDQDDLEDDDEEAYDPFSIWNRPRPDPSRPERTLQVFPLPEPELPPVELPPGFNPAIVRRGVICEDGNYRRPTRPVVVGCPLARREGDPRGIVSVEGRCLACEHFRGYDNNHSEKGLACALKDEAPNPSDSSASS
jgi:hypothetical protein